MLKKGASWLLLLSLLCSCFWILPASAEPASDADAAAQGYQAKYTASDGMVKYFRFDAVDSNQRSTMPADVPEGGTVELIADVTIGFELLLNGSYTIDGKGHTLTGAFRTDGSGADITIRDLNVVLTTLGAGNNYLYQLNAGNACVFEDCTFTVTGTPVFAVIIPRGELTMRNCGFIYTSEGAQPVFLPESDNQAVLENTAFDLSGAPNATMGLVAGAGNRYYNSWTKALNAASEGGTVTLLDNITVTGTDDRLIVSKAITLDGNGKTVSGSTGSYLVRFDATGTMKNLTVLQTGAAAAMQVNAGATATVEHSVIRCTTTSDIGTIVVQGGGKLILDNGAQVISEGSAANGTQSVGVRMNQAGSELVVNEGASITTVGNSFKANITNESKITINGGTVTTDRHMWEAAGDNRCTLIITGGTFVSNHAADALICVFGSKDQTVRLLGGNFTAPKIIDTEGALAELGGTVVHNGEVIFNEPMADDIENPNVDIRLPDGNAATLGNSGIRFETRVEKAWLDAMTEAGVTVATGTLIAAKASVEAAGAFTAEALEAAGKTYLDIANEGWYNVDAEDDFYQFYGTMVNLQESSLTGELSGIGYVTLTVPGLGSFTFYGDELTGIVRDLAADVTAQDDAQTAVLNFFRGIAD